MFSHKLIIQKYLLISAIVFMSFLLQIHTQQKQNKNNNLQTQVNFKSYTRILQSSLLGFDLSSFSSGSFGNSGSDINTPLINNKSINSSPAPVQIPVSTIKRAQITASSSQGVSYTKISNNQFAGITLYHEIPTKFLFNQIYTFRGSVSGFASKLNIIFSSISGDNSRITITQDLNGKSQFEIPVTMSIIGKFYLTMFTGVTGASTRTQYEIKNKQENIEFKVKSPNPIDQLSIYEKQNKIYVKWNNFNGQKNPIAKLVFEQYSTRSKVQLYFSNFVSQVLIPLKYFNGFEKGTVSLAAYQAESSTSSAVSRVSQFSNFKMIFFNAIKHGFSQTRPDLVSFDSVGYTFSTGSSLSISGKSLSKLKNQIVVLQPSKNFKTYLINGFLNEQGEISAGSIININCDISQEGVYIIEVNHKDGYAVLNRPSYVGNNIIPLIPDSQDLKTGTLTALQIANAQPQNINEQRNLILNLINAKRDEFGLNSLSLDDNLNTLAQQHSEDQVRRNYSSHFTPEGLSPTDRAMNMRIYEQIGENIGVNSNLTDAHFRLARSNIHLRNMVNAKWVRVGLGIKRNNNNSFIITQQFSTRDLSVQPLSQSELSSIKTDILSYVLFSSRSVSSQNLDLSNKMSTWHSTKLNARSAQLSSFLGTLGFSRYSGSVIRVTYNSQSATIVKQQPYLLPSSNVYTQIGISVKLNSGFLEVYVGYVA